MALTLCWTCCFGLVTPQTIMATNDRNKKYEIRKSTEATKYQTMRIIHIIIITVYDLRCTNRCNIKSYCFKYYNIHLDQNNYKQLNKMILISEFMHMGYLSHRTNHLV